MPMSRNVSLGEPTEESPYAIADVENALYEIDQQTQVVRTLNLQPPSNSLQRLLAMPKCGGMAGGGYIIGEGPIAGPITDCTPGTWLYAPQRPHTTLGAPLGTTRVVWHPKQPR